MATPIPSIYPFAGYRQGFVDASALFSVVSPQSSTGVLCDLQSDKAPQEARGGELGKRIEYLGSMSGDWERRDRLSLLSPGRSVRHLP